MVFRYDRTKCFQSERVQPPYKTHCDAVTLTCPHGVKRMFLLTQKFILFLNHETTIFMAPG